MINGEFIHKLYFILFTIFWFRYPNITFSINLDFAPKYANLHLGKILLYLSLNAIFQKAFSLLVSLVEPSYQDVRSLPHVTCPFHFSFYLIYYI